MCASLILAKIEEVRVLVVVTVLFLNFLSLPARAELICINSVDGYNLNKHKLPTLFRNLPLIVGGEDVGLVFDIFAVLNIHIRDGVLVMKSDSWRATERYTELREIKNSCFDTLKSTLTMTFSNDESFVVNYTNTEVKVSHKVGTLVLTKISVEQERSLIRKIEQKAKNNNTNNGGGGTE